MITIKNYYTEIEKITTTTLPDSIVKSGAFVDKVTNSGKSWETYHSSDSIKRTIDLYLSKLNEWVNNSSVNKKVIKKSAGNAVKNRPIKITVADIKVGAQFKIKSGTIFIIDEVKKDKGDKEFLVRAHYKGGQKGNYRDSISEMVSFLNDEGAVKLESKSQTSKKVGVKVEAKRQIIQPRSVKKKSKTARELAYDKAEKVETVSLELKLIKRFVMMHDKVKSQNQIRLFINALQKAIIEKRIRKTSPYAKEINKIQDYLLGLHGQFKSNKAMLQVDIAESVRSKYLILIGKQAELHSVKLIKSYINLQGKIITNLKAKNLFNRIASAINLNKLTKKDRYWNEIESIMATLKSFVKKNVEGGMLVVSSKELNGLQGIVLGCAVCDTNINGVNSIPRNTIMSSTDIVNLDFEKLGFSGKWKQLIGDPSSGFTAMIFGKPKMGKSYLAVDFGGYLARNHGTVLYVAREEGIDDTLQQKLKDKNVAHPDLYVSDYLPEDLSNYDFVFLDSVNKLGLNPDDLELLKLNYPNTSFVYIFQTTKQGNFRGGNEFQHDVDVVIEVPEKGKAIQFGRFNQGGEINIFN